MTKKTIHNKRGQFEVSQALYDQMDYNQFKAIFEDVFVVHVETNQCNQKITFSALSPYFDEVEEGENIPMYEFEFEMLKNGVIKRKSISKSDVRN